MQSEPSRHVIPLWSYIANLELYKGERDHNDTTAMQLIQSGSKMCRRCFNAYEKCTKLINSLRASIAKVHVADVIGKEAEPDNSKNAAAMLPPPPKRIAICQTLQQLHLM